MTKASVLTLHRVFNYGSAFQAYATQRVIASLGYEAEIVDYVTEQRTFRRTLASVLPARGIKRAAYAPVRSLSIAAKRRVFDGFIRRNLNVSRRRYVSVEDLRRRPPEADVYVTGSDQVWNSYYNEGVDLGFFLDFVPPGRRKIAYASSFGRPRLEPWEIDATRELIHRYAAISVREDTALGILDDLGYADATRVMDPTLQARSRDWDSLAAPRQVPEPYVLLLLLYNEDNGGTEAAGVVARELGLKLVKLSWEHIRPPEVDVLKSHVPPEAFLSLLRDADFVVTNSFHGLAFSLNFNRPFLAVPRNQFNTRIESLLRLTALEARMPASRDLETVRELAHRPIEYGPINALLEYEREKALAYLRAALNGSEIPAPGSPPRDEAVAHP